MIYEFELGYNPVEIAKNIFWAKNEGTVDHRTATWLMKKFRSGSNDFDDWARSGFEKAAHKILRETLGIRRAQHLTV